MVEGGNEKISPTRCVEDEDGFCPHLSSTRIPGGFLMKIRLVCTQLRTDFWSPNFCDLAKLVFFSKYSRWFRLTRRVFAIFHPKSPRGFSRFFSRWWFQIFLLFSSRTLGFHDPIWRYNIFQMGGEKPPVPVFSYHFPYRNSLQPCTLLWSLPPTPWSLGGRKWYPSNRQSTQGRPEATGLLGDGGLGRGWGFWPWPRVRVSCPFGNWENRRGTKLVIY